MRYFPTYWMEGVLIALSLAPIWSHAQSQPKTEIFASSQLQALLTSLLQKSKTTGSNGVILGQYNSHALLLSQRTASGRAEVHAHWDDVIIVLSGNATLVSNGVLVNPRAGANGEANGSAIQGGDTRLVGAGDVIHIPAGVPHQFLISPTSTCNSLVIKVKEYDAPK